MDALKPPHGLFETAASRTLVITQGLLMLLAILAVVLLIYGIYRTIRSKPKKAAMVKKNPWEEIRKNLRELAGRSPKIRFEISSLALRQGLELKTGKPFSAWTSREVLAELRNIPEFSSDFQTKCAEFLNTADRAVFAQEEIAEEDSLSWENQISTWLENFQLGRSS